MNNVSPGYRFSNFTGRTASAFSLIEILTVVAIIGVLAALLTTGMQSVRKSAAETKSVATMRSVLQGTALFAADNNGQIITVMDDGDPRLREGGRWVGNTFWGRVQPYLYPEITTTNQKQLSSQIRTQLENLFGSDDLVKMPGSPFEGAQVYGDTSGLPVPFAFNKYLSAWGKWTTLQFVDSLPGTIYATYGFYKFDEVDAATYEPLPEPGVRPSNNIYYLPTKRTIAGFLDGRVEFLTPPIAERMVKIDGSGQ